MIAPVIRKVTTMLRPRSAFASLISFLGDLESGYFFLRNPEYARTRLGVTVVASRDTARIALPPGILKEKPSVNSCPISGPDVQAVKTNASTIRIMST